MRKKKKKLYKRPLAAASSTSSDKKTLGRTRPIFFSQRDASSLMFSKLHDGLKWTFLFTVRTSSAALIVNFPISDPATK